MNTPSLLIAILLLAVLGGVLCEGSRAQRPKSDAEAEDTQTGKTIDNSIGVKLILIPAGVFMMGNSFSVETEQAVFGKPYGHKPFPARWFTDEYPRHRVRITKSFYLGTHEITVGQFRRFIQDSGYKTDAEKGPVKGAIGWDPEAVRFPFESSYSWRNTGFPQTDQHPVVNVSWNDAVAFCKWLSTKERDRYRLPTEAEWEYACRAGTATRYYNDDDPEKLPEVGNVNDATAKAKFPGFTYGIRASDGYVFTAPVGQFRSNALGVFDMHGNATEWCSDWYGKGYYATSPADEPSGPNSGEDRVRRGGSWFTIPVEARSAHRGMCEPDYRSFDCGFRIVKEYGENEDPRPTGMQNASVSDTGRKYGNGR